MDSTKGSRLLREERRRTILEVLDRDERVTVDELVAKFGVTAVTVRSDLDELSRMGAIVRSHGGAVKRIDTAPDFPLRFKEILHREEKERIAAAVMDLIHPGETIILDSGTTTAEIAREIRLRKTSLTVITNALNVALELSASPTTSVVMLGGILRPMSLSMVGPQSERSLQKLAADQLFLAVDGITPEVGFFTPDIVEAQLNSVMLKVSKTVTIVADFSKFQRRSLSLIGTMSEVHRVVTDDKIDGATRRSLEDMGVEVIIA
jgi:DeoR family transcriptional regulator, aga operon transcriptional repressor